MAQQKINSSQTQLTTDLSGTTGAALVGFTEAGSNIAQTTSQKLSRKLCVMDFIDRSMWSLIESGTQAGQNAALITAGIQAAIANAVSRKKRLDMTGGVYVHNALTISGAIEIDGEGRGTTTFIGSQANVNLWTFNADNSCSMSNMSLYGQNASSSGSIIQLNGTTGASYNSYSQFSNLTLGETFNGIHFRNAGGFSLRDSYLVDCYGSSALVENQASVDNGDSSISGCIIANPTNVGYGIKQISSGGLRIINNKGLGFKRFYWLEPIPAVATSILIVNGNSIEGFTEAGLWIDSGGGTLGSIAITGNEISVFGTGNTGIVSKVQQNLNFTGNVFRAGGSNEKGIDVFSGGPFIIAGNTFQANGGNTGIAINVQASANNGMISQQAFGGFGTNVVNASSSTANFAALGSMASQDSSNVTITNGQVQAAAVKAISIIPKSSSDASPFLVSSSDVTNPLQLLVGFAPGQMSMQAIEQGVSYRPLVLNPVSGNILVGTTTDAGPKLQVAGSAAIAGPTVIGQYTLATLPTASSNSGYLIMVTDATGGPKMCRSNGTVWQILNTTTTVS